MTYHHAFFVSLSLTFVDRGRMCNFPINQKIKTIKIIKGVDSLDYLVFFAIYLSCHSITPAMPEINQIIKNNQRILIFDFLLFAKIFFHGQTDQPTDQQTFALIEAPCRSLKTY